MKLQIDYPNHPGFKSLLEKPVRNVAELDTHFATLNKSYFNFLSQKRRFSKQEINSLIDLEISPVVMEMQCLAQDAMKPGEWYRPIVHQALQNLTETLRDEFYYREMQRRYRPRKIHKKSEKILNDLEVNKVSFNQIDPKKINKIWDSLQDFRTDLEQKKAERPKGMASCNISLPQRGDHWTLIKETFEDLGLFEAVNAYCKYPMNFDYCALQLSHEYEEWYKDCYSDVGLKTQSTAYMHCDQDFSLMKAIVNLSHVDEQKGPFSAILEENFLHGGYVQQRFLTQLDSVSIDLFVAGKKNIGVDYYRPIFKSSEWRKEFLNLPREFQGTTHFGDDLIDGSSLSQYLLSREIKLTSDVGNCALFVGGRVIHRGGTVPKGERWALQAGFRQKDSSLAGRIKSAERQIKLYTPTIFKRTFRKIKPRK